MRPIGSRVRITDQKGMPEFRGKTGRVIGNQEMDGSTRMYRVQLDEPVEIPGVGRVTDDLWAGSFLTTIRER